MATINDSSIIKLEATAEAKKAIAVATLGVLNLLCNLLASVLPTAPLTHAARLGCNAAPDEKATPSEPSPSGSRTEAKERRAASGDGNQHAWWNEGVEIIVNDVGKSMPAPYVVFDETDCVIGDPGDPVEHHFTSRLVGRKFAGMGGKNDGVEIIATPESGVHSYAAFYDTHCCIGDPGAGHPTPEARLVGQKFGGRRVTFATKNEGVEVIATPEPGVHSYAAFYNTDCCIGDPGAGHEMEEARLIGQRFGGHHASMATKNEGVEIIATPGSAVHSYASFYNTDCCICDPGAGRGTAEARSVGERFGGENTKVVDSVDHGAVCKALTGIGGHIPPSEALSGLTEWGEKGGGEVPMGLSTDGPLPSDFVAAVAALNFWSACVLKRLGAGNPEADWAVAGGRPPGKVAKGPGGAGPPSKIGKPSEGVDPLGRAGGPACATKDSVDPARGRV